MVEGTLRDRHISDIPRQPDRELARPRRTQRRPQGGNWAKSLRPHMRHPRQMSPIVADASWLWTK